MSYIVSARKYRPARFDEVVGQGNITLTLKNAIKNNKLAQSFLFCGPRGVGKTTCARILAKAINCTTLAQNIAEGGKLSANDIEPCGECSSCQSFENNASFNIFELDAASNNSVDDIRNLMEQVRFAPQNGKYKAYIIDEVHMLSTQAFNAFLKTLEEPPPHVIFILATTEKHKIIPTILSRCQIFDFGRIKVRDISKHLKGICADSNITAENDALHIIGQKADGALRDALSIFDRIAGFSDGNIRYKDVIETLNVLDYDYYFRFTDLLLSEDVSAALLLFDEVLQKGFEGNHFVGGLASHFRDLLVCKVPRTSRLLEVAEGVRKRYEEQALTAPASFLLNALNLANDCTLAYKTANDKRLQVELALIKMAYAGAAVQWSKQADQALPQTLNTPQKTVVATTQMPITKEPSVAKSGKVTQNTSDEARPLAPTKEPAETQKSIPKEEEKKKAKIVDDSEPPKKEGGNLLNTGKQPDGGLFGGLFEEPDKPPYKKVENKADELPPPKAQKKEVSESQAVVKLDESALVEHWKGFAESTQSELLRSYMKTSTPKLDGNEIIVTVSGKTKAQFLQGHSGEFFKYLNKNAGRTQLAMRVVVDKSLAPKTPTKPVLITHSDRLKVFQKQNPNIDEMIKRLGLEFDY